MWKTIIIKKITENHSLKQIQVIMLKIIGNIKIKN